MKRTYAYSGAQTYSANKAGPRGASRAAGAHAGKGWLRRVLGLMILAGLGVLAVRFVDLPIGFEVAVDRPVASVSVEGEFRFVSRERITERVAPLVNRKFLQLDLEEIKHSIEQEAYVDYAILSRRWPDRLSVRIVEQQPIARWGNKGFLNLRGDIVDTDELALIKHLPKLYGQRDQAADVMLQYQSVVRLLRPHGLEVVELTGDDKLSWQLQLANGLRIVIGRDQVMEKIQRFLAVYKSRLQSQLDKVELVDVRYSNGVAVRWREAAAHDDSLISAR